MSTEDAMAKRKNYGGKSARGKRGKSPSGSGALILGLAGLAGAGWVVKSRASDAEPIPAVALAAPGLPLAGPGPRGAAGAAPESSAAVPPELVASFARLAQPDPQALVDLRRLAVEFAGSPEGRRAVEALTREREARLAEARQIASAQPEAALRAMTRAYLATVDPATRRALRPEVEALSEALFFSPRSPGSSLTTTYAVKSGDSLSRIAGANKTEYVMIKRLNGLPHDRIRIGQKLRLPAAPTTVIIYKRDFEVILLLGDCLLRVFDCATGAEGRTPEGRFVIGTKLVDPDWYSPDGKVYPFGSEENVLGTRWLAFENTPEHQGFGIHGTKFPDSIGTEASMGCIRLRNPDAETVYDLVPAGSTVRIVR